MWRGRSGIIISLLILTLTSVNAAEPIRLQEAQIKSLGIVALSAANERLSSTIKIPAQTAIPNKQLRVIASPVAGLVNVLNVSAGDYVRQGQVVAQIISPQALDLERETNELKSQYRLAQQNLKRDQQLYREGLIAQSRLQTTEAQAAQISTQMNAKSKGLSLMGSNAQAGGILTIKSPITGVVLDVSSQMGQRVEAATAICRIGATTPLWLEMQVPRDAVNNIRLGDTVRAISQNQAAAQGRVITLGHTVEQNSQTVMVRALLEQGTGNLRPGQVLQAEIVVSAPATQQTVPASAVVYHEGGALVFVQQTDATFVPNKVKVIRANGANVTLEGVAANARVVVKGASGLKALMLGVGG